ncbi:PLP-dependent aminotransferase family protein [Rhodococcus sp. IEGM 1401]|uniref:PLP-dependent aminotransferase family protein n=1 Tax=Rhodococcus cerastii TaxID=908616 RepID=A0ABU4D090_9NOCA|nr:MULTISPECIES: PLP-dependent aminotransferase family protein [Rhodococcus]MCZ4562965.1 PLP-dependent aminotransferase family protein [Rhodococcus sp. IEGM 1401]MDI9923127.1 PLP-dependent aminotransferase family protein [Rhodococcus sp. IEGM 1372]MDV6303138.1 PLP-dependent aminotransferase family protein [Rhodococcus cerastii]MDV8035674.1 PLP-dependent aminotransferase family protein [Rhodococcus sp. IEGM 1414]MDV8054735.1 PLP-dependent aminotransferase family protein [Rhodococcus sp. IEGM 13
MSDDSSSRIVSALRIWIATAPPEARLPSTRALVAEHSASPVTVQKALRTLIAQGVIESRPGVGTFVKTVRTARPNDYGWQTAALGAPDNRLQLPAALQSTSSDVIALHSGYPARELLPERLVHAAFTRASRTDAVIDRPPTAGLPELRAWFAAELGASTPLGITPPSASDVVIIPGSQTGLSTAFRALVGAGRPLLMESPTYWGAILAATQAGVRVVPIPSGVDGPDPDALARAFAHTGARAFYAQPTFASPTGAQWSPTLSEQVLATVRRHGAFLIEDDSAHDFGITAEPSPLAARDDAGHVVYLRSLTKTVSPSVRLAGLIARGPAHERILADTGAESMYVSGILQAVALDVVTQPAWRTHLRRLRTQLASRRDLLANSLIEFAPRGHLDAVPRGGLNLWMRLSDDADLERIVRECKSAGVIVGAGDDYFPAEPTGKYLRLNYAGPNPGEFADAARTIGSII